MFRRILAILALSAVAACTNMNEGRWSTADVVALAPAPGSSSAARADTVRLSMSMPMDSASCAARFTLHRGDSLGPEVPGRVRYDEGNRRMLFIPDVPLEPATPYFAHMRDGMAMSSAAHSGSGGMMVAGGMMGSATMMTGAIPTGAVRMSDGMGWSFTTRN